MSERPPSDLAVCVERDPVGGRIAPDKPGFSRIDPVGAVGIGIGLGVFAAGHPADQPGATAERFVQALEQPRHAVLGGPPPAAENAAVDARVHVADYVRLHIRIPCR